MVYGDFIFKEWDQDAWKNFRKKVHELRVAGFRKINQEHDYLNYYECYKKKNSKKVITITMMCF
jgi:hypothetical protein